MSERLIEQERPGEDEQVVAKSKPMQNLVSKTVDRSPTALSSSASYCPGTLTAKSSNLDLTSMGKLVIRDSDENTVSSSQVRQSDVNPSSSTGKTVAETTMNPIVTRLSHHNLTVCRNCVGHLEKVHSNVRQKLGRQAGDDTPEIDANKMM